VLSIRRLKQSFVAVYAHARAAGDATTIDKTWPGR
jgi:hypothetical protein